MINFLREIGIIPILSIKIFLISFMQLFIICGVGFLMIYLICKFINKNLSSLTLSSLFDSVITNWEKSFYKKLLWAYPLWGFVQQLIIIVIFYFIRKLFVSEWIPITISAFIFAGLHFPNIYLFLATFGLEQLLLNYFLTCHNLYFLGFIHGFLGTTLLYFSPTFVFTRFSTWKNYWELYK